MKTTIATIAALLLPPLTAHSRPPPLPVYDGCVLGAEVRIVTGAKRVLDKDKKPLDLSAYKGKRIRFKGYLQRDPVLVMLDAEPTVVGPCRPAPHLPRSTETIAQALTGSRQADGPCRAAVVRAITDPLHSGGLEGRQILSNDFELVESLDGPWPKTSKFVYTASVPDNERAIAKGETVILIRVEDKRFASPRAGMVLADTAENRKRVSAGSKACKP